MNDMSMPANDVAALYRQTCHKLSPSARDVYAYIRKHGSISAHDAERSKELCGIVSGSLTARLSDLRKVGFKIKREFKTDPISRRRYSRYSFEGVQA